MVRTYIEAFAVGDLEELVKIVLGFIGSATQNQEHSSKKESFLAGRAPFVFYPRLQLGYSLFVWKRKTR